MDLRFYEDPDTGQLHIFNQGLRKKKFARCSLTLGKTSRALMTPE
jgi:hypothetical protein